MRERRPHGHRARRHRLAAHGPGRAAGRARRPRRPRRRRRSCRCLPRPGPPREDAGRGRGDGGAAPGHRRRELRDRRRQRSRRLVAPGAVRGAVGAPVRRCSTRSRASPPPTACARSCTPTPTRSSRPPTRSSGSSSPRRSADLPRHRPPHGRAAPIPWPSPTRYASRVGLVHLKDVRTAVADRLQRRRAAVDGRRPGRPVRAAGRRRRARSPTTITSLERQGYDGLYVLEQDVAITDGEPPARRRPRARRRQERRVPPVTRRLPRRYGPPGEQRWRGRLITNHRPRGGPDIQPP